MQWLKKINSERSGGCAKLELSLDSWSGSQIRSKDNIFRKSKKFAVLIKKNILFPLPGRNHTS